MTKPVGTVCAASAALVPAAVRTTRRERIFITSGNSRDGTERERGVNGASLYAPARPHGQSDRHHGIRPGGGARSAGGLEVAGPAQHLLDLGDVPLLELDLLARVLLEPHVLVDDAVEQLVVEVDRRTLVVERLAQDLLDVVLVRLG